METESIQLPFLLLGLAVGLFGWMIYWAGLPLIGGVVGAGAGASLGYLAAGAVQSPSALPFLLGAGLILGAVMGVFLMRALQLYFFFAVGASLGGAGVFHLIERGLLSGFVQPPPHWEGFLAIAFGALVLGLVLVKLRRFIVAVVTSVIGAVLVTVGLGPESANLVLPISLIVFLGVQIGLVRKFVDTKGFDRRARQDLMRRRAS